MALRPYALTTVDAVLEAADLPDKPTRLERLINSASSQIQRYLGRQLGYADCTAAPEWYAGSGTPRIYLKRYPIWSVASVVQAVGTQTLALTDWQLISNSDPEELSSLYRRLGWPLAADRFNDLTGDLDPDFPLLTLQIGYVAGYVLPPWSCVEDGTNNPDAAVTNLPDEIEEACIRSVIVNATRPQLANLTAEETPGGAKQSFARPNQDKGFSLPPEVLEQLDPYLWAGGL